MDKMISRWFLVLNKAYIQAIMYFSLSLSLSLSVCVYCWNLIMITVFSMAGCWKLLMIEKEKPAYCPLAFLYYNTQFENLRLYSPTSPIPPHPLFPTIRPFFCPL